MTHTLGNGLKVGQKDSTAIELFVLIFLLARLAFAASIVFYHENVSFGAFILLTTSFTMLTLQARGKLWKDISIIA